MRARGLSHRENWCNHVLESTKCYFKLEKKRTVVTEHGARAQEQARDEAVRVAVEGVGSSDEVGEAANEPSALSRRHQSAPPQPCH